MKKILILFLLFSVKMSAQQNTIIFTYDQSGNQTMRELICINCRQANSTDSNSTEFTQSDEYIELSYYPNPVTEVLHIKWKNSLKSSVNSIEVFSTSGQKLNSTLITLQEENFEVNFYNHQQGMYNVILYYTDGQKKTFKIIKK